MLRAALKALVYLALVWFIAAKWQAGREAFMTAAQWAAWSPWSSNQAALVGICILIIALHLASALLLVAPVPMDRSLGPLRHPLPAHPVRIRLRLRPSRFLALFFLWSLTLVVAMRVLPELVDPRQVLVPRWADVSDWADAWLLHGVLHGAVALVLGFGLFGVGRVLTRFSPVVWGFMGYHARYRPITGCVLRLLLIMHWPIASFSATHLGHPWHVYLVMSALVGVCGAALIALVITLWIERSRDRWLASLVPDGYRIQERAVHFLHPEVGPPYEPGMRAGPIPVPLEDPTTALTSATDEESAQEMGPAFGAASPPTPAFGLPPVHRVGPDHNYGFGADTDSVVNQEIGAAPAFSDEPAHRLHATPQDSPASDGLVDDAPVLDDEPPMRDTEGGAVAARTLNEALVSRERGEFAKARALLGQVIATGGIVERQRATAILRALPSRWRVWRYGGLALATVGAAGLTLLAWQWFALPSAEDTLQLARAAHVHVRKSGSAADSKVVLLGTRYDYSLNTSLNNISPHFVNAVIASEDHRFYHHGVFYKLAKFAEAGVLCTLRKLNMFSSTKACAGNSTISQQLARNLFLSENRSVKRKLAELLWAIKMEFGLTKEQILELYMNRLYLGRGNFGVELAARTYFLKSARDLTLYEAAYLAAAVKRPGWNWHEDRAGAQRRAALIVALMRQRGYADASAKMPKSFKPRFGGRPPSKPYLGHLWQWIRPQVVAVFEDLPAGDYKVVTTLNAEVEIYAERALRLELKRLRRKGIAVSQAAAVVMRPSGEILAMVGGVGSDVRARGFNRAKRTVGLHLRPPASAFKPFVYLAALEQGLQPTSRIDARPVSIAMPAPQPPYAPRNYDGKDYGYVTMREGLVNSINTAAVNLLHGTIGFERLFDVLARLSIDTTYVKRQWGLALGANGVPLVEMVGAYGVFANGGRAVEPYAFSRITRADGRTVWRHGRPSLSRRFAVGDIAAMNDMLVSVVSEGTATQARRTLPENLVIAGKTGTGDGFVDAWFVGYSPDLVIGIWMGNDTPRTMQGLFGGVGPAHAFNRLMSDLVKHTGLVRPGLSF